MIVILNLYFGTVSRIISTVLIIVAACLIAYVIKNHDDYQYWDRTFYILFAMGLFMSIMSGTRDAIGTPDGFPTEGTLFIALCVLGVMGFVIVFVGLLSKLGKSNMVFHYGSYILMAIIVIKTWLVEGKRIIEFLS